MMHPQFVNRLFVSLSRCLSWFLQSSSRRLIDFANINHIRHSRIELSQQNKPESAESADVTSQWKSIHSSVEGEKTEVSICGVVLLPLSMEQRSLEMRNVWIFASRKIPKRRKNKVLLVSLMFHHHMINHMDMVHSVEVQSFHYYYYN